MSNDFTSRPEICYYTTMTTQTLMRNLQKEVKTLQKEVAFLKSAFFVPYDDEGEYKPRFVKEVLRAAKSKTWHHYNGKTDPLSRLLVKAKRHA